MTGLPPELVAAVLADFDDDAPRLACADWLDEHGDPDAARLVRLQCRLARRDALRLSTVEYSRGLDEARRLVRGNQERWLAPLVEVLPNRVVTATWGRGFVTELGVRFRLPNLGANPEDLGILGRLAVTPLAESLSLGGLAPLPPAALDDLPALPRLRSLTLRLDLPDGRVPDAVLGRLADYPRLIWIQLLAPGSPGGENAVTHPHHVRIHQLRRERLRDVPDAGLLQALEPRVDHLRRARGGRVSLGHHQAAALDATVLARVPGLASLQLGAPELPAWVGRHGGTLRSLGVSGLERFGGPEAEPWRALRGGLTALHLTEARLPADGWERVTRFGEAAPRLASVTFGAAAGFAGPTPEQFARLARLPRVRRLVSALEGLSDKWPSLELATEFESAGGISLRLPPEFVRRASTPAGDVEILGEWVEWGDGDPGDRLDPRGPAWLALERLPFPVRVADARRLLTGPPGGLAAPHAWEAARRVETPRGPAHRAEGPCAFGWHWRWLWPGRTGGLRLRLEVPTGRIGEWARVGDEIAASVGA